MTKLVLGTAQLGTAYGIIQNRENKSLESASRILKAATNNCILELDTASSYKNSLQMIASYHSNNTKFKIGTKIGSDTSVGQIAEKIENELKIFQIDSFEIVYFHNYLNQQKNHLLNKCLRDLKQKNKIKYVGASIYTLSELEKAVYDDTIDIIQTPFNLLDNDLHRGRLLGLAKKLGKKIYARSIYLQGLLLNNVNDTRTIHLHEIVSIIKQLNAISKKFDLSMLELAIRYVNSFNYIDKIIVGVNSENELQELFNAQKFELDPEIINKIHQIKKIDHNKLLPINWQK